MRRNKQTQDLVEVRLRLAIPSTESGNFLGSATLALQKLAGKYDFHLETACSQARPRSRRKQPKGYASQEQELDLTLFY